VADVENHTAAVIQVREYDPKKRDAGAFVGHSGYRLRGYTDVQVQQQVAAHRQHVHGPCLAAVAATGALRQAHMYPVLTSTACGTKAILSMVRGLAATVVENNAEREMEHWKKAAGASNGR